MPVQDLGYRNYEGRILSPAHTVKVLWRYGLQRAWRSWFIKLSILFCWTTALIPVGYIALSYYMMNASAQSSKPMASNLNGANIIYSLCQWQLWLFVIVIAVKIGANAISEDLSQKVFPFFFAKPVSQLYYLVGRISAVGTIVFVVTAVPALLVVLALCLAAPRGALLQNAFLALPTLGYALIIAFVTATTSVGLSAISKSRALTVTTWLLVWIVPYVIAGIVVLISDNAWSTLASLPSLLGHVGQTLFQISDKTPSPMKPIPWFYGAGILAILVTASIALARWRLKSVEVVQ